MIMTALLGAVYIYAAFAACIVAFGAFLWVYETMASKKE